VPKAGLSIVFDLDGTLLDVSSRHYLVYAELVRRLGRQPLAKERYWRLKRSMATWKEILALSALPPGSTQGFLEGFRGEIEKTERLATDVIIASAEKVLDSLAGEHDLYLVSLRRSAAAFERQLVALGLRRRFKNVASAPAGNEPHHRKARLVRDMLVHGGGVMVGDTEVDVQAAQILGLCSVAVASGLRDEECLARVSPDHLVSDVGALPDIVEMIGNG
jgi:phosphoglycolate phosphatase-like HAD superfamily hydrolase